MAMGRGSAKSKMAIVMGFACLLLLHCHIVESAKTYTVGDRNGWTFNTASWVSGKSFKAGDVLVFKYNSAVHDVVPVNAAGYQKCNTGGAKALKSGNDKITLARGRNFFICSFKGHCQSGMKIAVTAA